MTAPFIVKRLGKEDRSDFRCGKDELDQYFKARISQDVKRNIAAAFVAVDSEIQEIAGFYTLSACQVPFLDVNDDWRKRLPNYPSLPAVLVGRLAIDQRYKGQGLGGALLADAAIRSLESDVGAHFMIVDALDEDAALFYQHHGFRRTPGDERRLFIPLTALKNL